MALYTKESAAASFFRSKLADSPENPVYLHGMGLTLSRLGKRDEAIEYLRRALKKQAFSPVILTDLGKMYYLDGQVENAVNMLEGALSLRSDYPPALYYLGRLRLETGRYDSAKALLKKLQEKEPKLYSDGPYFLGQALGRLGETGESHFQFAVYHQSKGDLKTARYHLKKALSLTTEAGRKKEMKNLLEKIDKARSEQDDRFGPP
jgi:predicted Zn-dependent protease